MRRGVQGKNPNTTPSTGDRPGVWKGQTGECRCVLGYYVALDYKPGDKIETFDSRKTRYGTRWRLLHTCLSSNDRLLVLPCLQQLLDVDAPIIFPHELNDKLKRKLRSKERYRRYSILLSEQQ